MATNEEIDKKILIDALAAIQLSKSDSEQPNMELINLLNVDDDFTVIQDLAFALLADRFGIKKI